MDRGRRRRTVHRGFANERQGKPRPDWPAWRGYARVTTIILPQQNRRDLDEVPKEPFKDIRFVFVDNMRQVFREALGEKVVPPITSGPRPQRVPQAANVRPA